MRRRVLMIDDDPDIREVATLSMETMGGWETIQAGSSEEGLRLAEQENPDVILLDLMMPDVDGKQTLEMLKSNERTKHIPVLLMTAKPSGSERDEMMNLGIKAALEKPFDPVTLCDEISEVMGWDGE